MMNSNFLTKKKLRKIVEDYVTSLEMSHMDAVLKVCEDRGIDPEDISRLIDENLKQKIATEAIKANMVSSDVRPGNTLPI